MPTALETALTALATLERTALNGLVRSGLVYERPPAEGIANLPAVVNVWTEEEGSEFPDGEAPTGRHWLLETVEARVYTNAPDTARAQATLLPIVNALRTCINTNKTLSGSCLWARYVSARAEKLEYGGAEFHGAVVTINFRLDVAGNFAS